MGGKSRVAKSLAEVMLDQSQKRGVYYEPFVGGGAMATKMGSHFDYAYYSDINQDLMLMWDAAINQGWRPTEDIPYEKYQELRYSEEHSALRGFAGIQLSFGGRWFEGFAKDSSGTNYTQQGIRVLDRDTKGMTAKVQTVCNFGSYDTPVEFPAPPLIYCDPPYENTKNYSRMGKFDHERFWETCRLWSQYGADVFISEYNAPSDFECVWEGATVGQLDLRKKRTNPTEKLYTYRKVSE